jgi:tRNA(Ile)-lysidine synthase
MDIIRRAKETVERYGLFRPGDSIVVGVSGGADSVALLYVLRQLRPEYGLTLTVVHCNHQLRKSADADQKFVEQLCYDLLLPCKVVRLTIKGKGERGSWEDLAREKRLAALTRIARETHAQRIALAHHGDDCAETVLLHILRGTGLQGLQGILPIRKINNISVIRPLIKLRKADILRFLAQRKISFRDDETNTQTRFFRNKIRLKLLPLLARDYQRNIKNILAGLAETVGLDYDYLANQVEDQAKKVIYPSAGNRNPGQIFLKVELLKKLHPSLRYMLLRRAFFQIQGNTKRLTLTHIVKMDAFLFTASVGAILSLPSGIEMQKQKGLLRLRNKYGR